MSSVRAASRAEPSRIALAVDGRLYLVGQLTRFAEIGGRSSMAVNAQDAFLLALAPR